MIEPGLSAFEHKLINSLINNKIKFMIVGQTAAILQGAITTTYDIDLWVKDLGNEQFLKAVREAGASYVAPFVAGSNPPMLAPKEFETIDLVTNMHGLDSFDEEFQHIVEIEIDDLKIPVLRLEQVIESKKAANREKDKIAMPALEAALVARDTIQNKDK